MAGNTEHIHGEVADGYGAVADAFVGNFADADDFTNRIFKFIDCAVAFLNHAVCFNEFESESEWFGFDQLDDPNITSHAIHRCCDVVRICILNIWIAHNLVFDCNFTHKKSSIQGPWNPQAEQKYVTA